MACLPSVFIGVYSGQAGRVEACLSLFAYWPGLLESPTPLVLGTLYLTVIKGTGGCLSEILTLAFVLRYILHGCIVSRYGWPYHSFLLCLENFGNDRRGFAKVRLYNGHDLRSRGCGVGVGRG